MDNTRVFRMTFASVYPHYITKAEKKGRTREEVHTIIHWLTGYDEQTVQQQIDKKVDFEAFFAQSKATPFTHLRGRHPGRPGPFIF